MRLEGSFNASPESLQPAALLAEAFRVLRPGGKIVVHVLVASQPLAGPARLPGLAALVQYVPTADEIVALLRAASFASFFFEKLGSVSCLQVAGVELREMRLLAWRPYPGAARDRHLLYEGPLAQVRDEDGTVYPRGLAVAVTTDTWQRLRDGPAAGQFLLVRCAPE